MHGSTVHVVPHTGIPHPYLEHLEVRRVPKFDAELTQNSSSDLPKKENYAFMLSGVGSLYTADGVELLGALLRHLCV